mgnify:CR=1 FL=1
MTDIYFQQNNPPDVNIVGETQVTTDGNSSMPAAYRAKARIYIVFQRSNNWRVIYSDDLYGAGATWQGDTVALTNAGNPDIAYDENSNFAHLAYYYGSTICYARSSDGFVTVKNAGDTTITNGTNGTQVVGNVTTEQSPAITIDKGATLRVTYKDNNGTLQHKKSTDTGKTWTTV